MGRYGYLDCEEGYSDVADWKVEATCAHCGKTVIMDREQCWNPSDLEEDKWICECGCTEYDDEADDNPDGTARPCAIPGEYIKDGLHDDDELTEEDLGNWETGLPEWDLLED